MRSRRLNLRITIRVLEPDNKSTMSDEYMVWRTIEDTGVYGYCAVLNHRIVRASEMATLGYPPCHAGCRCNVVSVAENYGELKPVIYYHRLPYEFETWDRIGRPSLRTARISIK